MKELLGLLWGRNNLKLTADENGEAIEENVECHLKIIFYKVIV